MTTWADLPTEVIMMIFSFLRFLDLHNAATTCKKLSDIYEEQEEPILLDYFHGRCCLSELSRLRKVLRCRMDRDVQKALRFFMAVCRDKGDAFTHNFIDGLPLVERLLEEGFNDEALSVLRTLNSPLFWNLSSTKVAVLLLRRCQETSHLVQPETPMGGRKSWTVWRHPSQRLAPAPFVPATCNTRTMTR